MGLKRLTWWMRALLAAYILAPVLAGIVLGAAIFGLLPELEAYVVSAVVGSAFFVLGIPAVTRILRTAKRDGLK